MAGDKQHVGEFEMIARHFAPLAAGEPGAWGLRDDAATLAVEPGRDLVVTSDCLVAGVHFLDTASPADIAYRALAVNLSDLAAMGARPRGYTLALALPAAERESADWLAAFAGSLGETQDRFAIPLIGGDTVSTPGPLTLTVTALGTVAAGAALNCGGAREGDGIFVSGTLGDAALGLRLLQGDLPNLAEDARTMLAGRHLWPTPRLELGQALVGLATAAADVSDGLIADIGHVCAASGVAARIGMADVPCSDAARTAIRLDSDLALLPLMGGDDYELVFTLPPTAVDEARARAAKIGVEIGQIGSIGKGTGVEVFDDSGRRLHLDVAGFHHF